MPIVIGLMVLEGLEELVRIGTIDLPENMVVETMEVVVVM